MSVAFLDLQRISARDRDALVTAFSSVLDESWFVLGRQVAEFEAEYARYVQRQYSVGVANGLDALVLSLRALNIGAGDEVIVPANTFIATWLAVSHVGAIPVGVEPDPATYNIDPIRIAAAITPQTRAIMPVHLYGQPADLDPIIAIATENGLRILEDAAQAHGACYRGRRLGGGGDVVAWSFYPGKNLGALGDGGAVTTDDEELAGRIRLLGNYGSRKKYCNEAIGYNSRLDELQAAFLRVKLARLDDDNQRRKDIAGRYLSGLQGLGIGLPHVPEWADPVWHLFVIRHADRDGLAHRLRDAGVQTIIHYPVPPHLQPAYRHLGIEEGRFPLSEAIHREVLSLPMGPTMSDEDVDFVIDAVRRLV